MRKLLLFTAALLCAASMWADPIKEGPWTYLEKNTMTCDKDKHQSIRYSDFDGSIWGDHNAEDITFLHNGDGTGFQYTGKNTKGDKKMGIFSIYKGTFVARSYARMTMNWQLQVRSMSTKHHAATVLYQKEGSPDSSDEIKNLEVDFSEDYTVKKGSQYCLDWYYNPYQDGIKKVGNTRTRTFEIDNLSGNTEQSKTWYLMLTRVIGSGSKAKDDLNEWGTFKHIAIDTVWTYRNIITFDKNSPEATGTMEEQIIDGSGNLAANAFSLANYTFAGWATEPNGEVVYPNQGKLNVTEQARGPRTLYAKWVPTNYNISYTLNGGEIADPKTSYNIETATFTLTNPTKAGFTFVGWTGDNGNTPQTVVQIALGSTGDKQYLAHWIDATPRVQGPWTQLEMKTVTSTKNENASMTFNQMDYTQWPGTISNWDENGPGYTFTGTSPINSKVGIFSTYRCQSEVPSYTRMTLTWKFKLYSKSTEHHSAVCLYGLPDSEDQMKNLEVDFSNHIDTKTGAEYLLASHKNTNEDGKVVASGTKTAKLHLDNREGNDSQTKAWYMMATYVIAGHDAQIQTGLNESGSFQNVSIDTTWTYYKIFTFDKNADDATGEMAQAVVDGGGNLPANVFARNAFVFSGWATSPSGPVAYANLATITATANDKGPQGTLYAVWTPVTEGLWSQLEPAKTDTCANDGPTTKKSYNQMNNKQWEGTVSKWEANGTGFNFTGSSPDESVMGIFSTYKCDVVVPAYTTMTLRWKFNLYSKCTGHHSAVCLYGLPDSRDQLEALAVDFTNHYKDSAGAEYLLAKHLNENQDGDLVKSGNKSVALDFNNSVGSTPQTKSWYMMMTFVVASAGGKTGLNLNGSFKHAGVDTTWTYYKVFTFNANGGDGEMDQAVVDNGDNLPANAFLRDGYTFAGWSTEPNGDIIYTDQATVMVSAEDRGLQPTLYAQWTEWGHGTTEGPWTQLDRNNMACAKAANPSISFGELDNTLWNGTISNIRDDYGLGFIYTGPSPSEGKMGIFSTYKKEVELPAYSRMTMKWRYSLFSKTTQHHSTTCLYAADDYSQLTDLKVDFSNHYDTQTGSQNLLARITRYDQKGDKGNKAYTAVRNTGFQFHTFTFDNINGSEQQSKKWYLLLTHVIASAEAKTGLDEWATFKSQHVDTIWTYRKIVTFNANEGSGEMANQIIDNSGRLTPNAFTRAGYVFIGWATSPNGPVVYNDGEMILVTAEDKGPQTLYAQWATGGYESITLNELLTHVGMKSGMCHIRDNDSICYNRLGSSHWGTITSYKQNDSISYKVTGSSADNNKNAIFSIYKHDESVPAYSSVNLIWTYRLGSKSTKHHSTVCLYGLPDAPTQIMGLSVDFSNHYDTEYGSEYLLAAPFTHTEQDGQTRYADQASVLTFDNRDGNAQQTKSWYILFTYVLASAGGKSDLNEVGYFTNLHVKKVWTYRKMVTFNANGGDGTMAKAIVDNAGNLPANTFVREGYTFAGWATEPNGEKAYDDQAAITATSDSKGLVNLYAKWTPVNYSISYEPNDDTAENPTNYNPETATFTLANPTKTGFTFLGWTGSNGAIPQTTVTIAQGSTGDKTYTANWMSNAVNATRDLIDAIGVVSDSAECKARIDAARTAYNELSEDDKALVANYSALTHAEAAYEMAINEEGNSAIRFMDQNDTPVAIQRIEMDYPVAPEEPGFTFQYWRVAEKNLSDGIIRLQAVYQSDDPTDIDETIVNGQSSNRKFIKDGNLYILKEEFIYTINGQRVNK